jgi:hypothetical protein
MRHVIRALIIIGGAIFVVAGIFDFIVFNLTGLFHWVAGVVLIVLGLSITIRKKSLQ